MLLRTTGPRPTSVPAALVETAQIASRCAVIAAVPFAFDAAPACPTWWGQGARAQGSNVPGHLTDGTSEKGSADRSRAYPGGGGIGANSGVAPTSSRAQGRFQPTTRSAQHNGNPRRRRAEPAHGQHRQARGPTARLSITSPGRRLIVLLGTSAEITTLARGRRPPTAAAASRIAATSSRYDRPGAFATPGQWERAQRLPLRRAQKMFKNRT